MPIMSKPSGAPRTSLWFITLGTLMTIWSGVWYTRSNPSSETWKIVLTGLLLTGIAFLIIGFSVGFIARQARHAELPPSEVTNAVARNELAAVPANYAPAAAPQPLPGNAGAVVGTPPPTTVSQAGPTGNNP